MEKAFIPVWVFVFILLLATQTQSQPTTPARLRLGALGGVSRQQWTAVGPSKMEPPGTAPMLGAGAAWMRGRWSIGGEFYHAGHTRQAATYSAQVSSFSSTLHCAYAIWQAGFWRAELSAGVGSLRQQLIINSSASAGPLDIRSNSLVWQPGLQLLRFSPKGMWWAVQLTYEDSWGQPDWKNSLGETNSDYRGAIDSWQLRFCTGGWIRLGGR